MRSARLTRAVVLGVLAVLVPILTLAQQRGRRRGGVDPSWQGYVQGGDLGDIKNPPYDGRFTFFRVRYEPLGEGGFGFRVDRKWDHDTPRAEVHFMKILQELTTLQPFLNGGTILSLSEKEIFKYPIAYISEPGFWTLDQQEMTNLRAYVQKGGFVIFDDFSQEQWYNFEERWRQVFPDLKIVELDKSHPIFDSFFHIDSLDFYHPYFGGKASFHGAYEDNDPKKRLVMIANYNNDLGDYMEWSDEGFLPIALTNEAYKLGVNYIIYAMTH